MDVLHVPVCVVGGGMTGLSAAYSVAREGIPVVVLEKGKVGYGASGRSGGQVLPGFLPNEGSISKRYGRVTAEKMFQASLEGVNFVREFVKKTRSGWNSGHVYVGLKPLHKKELVDWKKHLEDIGQYKDLELLSGHELRSDYICSKMYSSGMVDGNSGHVHPLNYTLALAKEAEVNGARIFENSAVEEMKEVSGDAYPYHIRTSSGGEIHSKFVFLCTNGYLFNSPHKTFRMYQRRVLPVSTFMIGTEPLPDEVLAEMFAGRFKDIPAFADMKEVTTYFRVSPEDNRLLFGGHAGHSWGYDDISKLRRIHVRRAKKLTREMTDVFPILKRFAVEYTWSGYCGMTGTEMPLVRHLHGGVFTAGALNGHGVAFSYVAGKALQNAISGDTSLLDLFSRIRHLLIPKSPIVRIPATYTALAWYGLRDII